MSLDGTVDVPAFGATKKKTLIYVGAGVVLLVGVYWYRQHNAGAGVDVAASDSESGAIDPATGYPAGSPEDAAALADQAAQSAGAGDGSGSAPVGSLLGGTSQTLAGPVFSDNRAWSQYASDYLVNVSRLHAGAVSEAMGAYLTGHDVDSDARNIIDQAIAYAGYPPVAGTGGYPPSIKVKSAPAARNAVNPVTHLRATEGRLSFTVLWDAAPRAHSYSVRLGNAPAIETRATNHTFRQLKAGTGYTVRVKALPAAAGAKWASITVHTKK